MSRLTRVLPLLASASLAMLWTLACSREPEPPRNVIFVLVDTLRADHLGIYGYARDTSPNLDAFARRSVFFRDARSQASCTFPSVNSMLTSRYPAAFLGQPNQAMGIPERIPSLAEILRLRGYRTVAVSASAVVRNTPSQHNPSAGFGRGFEVFQEDCVWKAAACVNRQVLGRQVLGRQALGHLRRSGDDGDGGDERPLFLYIHYLDPHGPYNPPHGHPLRFAKGKPEKPFIRNGNPNPIGDMLYKGAPDPGVTPADLQHLIDLYDDEIVYFDAQWVHLLRALEEGGWLDDSIVVFASDHGEEFLEHGHIKHCRTVFDNSVKVPLFFHIPGVAARTLEQPVQNLDIVPTLLDYLGLPATGLSLEGESLRPLIETETTGDPHQYSLSGPYRSVADGRFKLIQDLGGDAFWLFDLQKDPGETHDVLAAERRTFHRLRDALGGWLAQTEGQGRADESLRKAREAEEKLRSLGYLE